MKRIIIPKYGNPEVLELIEDDCPEPARGQVRLRMRATGVAFADLLMRRGAYPGAPRPPFSPGYDVVGIIEALGDGVTAWRNGQRVAALTVMGGYAERLCVDADSLVAVPPEVSDADAVSVVLNYGTAFQMLYRSASVQPGDAILIHGAAGGVGTALLQLARRNDLVAYGTASASKHRLVEDLGGIPIDYREIDFVSYLRRETTRGVAAVFDHVGGSHLRRSWSVLHPGGTLVGYGIAAAIEGRRRNRWVLPTTALLLGAMKFSRTRRATMYAINLEHLRRRHRLTQDLATVMELLARGDIAPIVSAVLPLSRAAEAHALLENSAITGKLVLVPD